MESTWFSHLFACNTVSHAVTFVSKYSGKYLLSLVKVPRVFYFLDSSNNNHCQTITVRQNVLIHSLGRTGENRRVHNVRFTDFLTGGHESFSVHNFKDNFSLISK